MATLLTAFARLFNRLPGKQNQIVRQLLGVAIFMALLLILNQRIVIPTNTKILFSWHCVTRDSPPPQKKKNVDTVPVGIAASCRRSALFASTHKLILENAEAPEEVDRVEEDAVGLAGHRAVLYPHLHFRYPYLVFCSLQGDVERQSIPVHHPHDVLHLLDLGQDIQYLPIYTLPTVGDDSDCTGSVLCLNVSVD